METPKLTIITEAGVGLLFLVFLALKLTGTVTWSWWWITAPLWITAAIGFGLLIFGALFFALFTRS